MKILPARFIRGTIRMPGDKSISHRAALISAMAEGETRIENFAANADCASTLSCLESLGVEIGHDGNTVSVKGVGKNGFLPPSAPLDCGNSGTTLRLLAGILAGQAFESKLTGDSSLRTRPMARIIEPLERMGAEIDSDDGRAPLTIRGKRPLVSIDYRLPVASAQIKSCILLAGLNSAGVTSVIEPFPTRDHTERMLRWFGVDVVTAAADGQRVSVSGEALLRPRPISVPSDISSAAFFMVAAACLDGSEITLPDIGFNPSRRAIVDILDSLGARLERRETGEVCNEPVATIHIRGGLDLTNTGSTPVLGGAVIANLIDEIPILAILGTRLHAGLEIRDAGELRVKESDRISSTVDNLRRMGADVTEFDDGFSVRRSQLTGAPVDAFGDHRIAMAFAIAGLLASGETEISGAGCADISFPGFYETLAGVVR